MKLSYSNIWYHFCTILQQEISLKYAYELTDTLFY